VISDGYFSGGPAGWIEVICGVMFSGKSEELIRRVRRAIIAKRKVQVFKSHLDERYAGIYRISSHDGRSVDAVPIDTPDQIAQLVHPETQVVAIDEAQFLDPSIVELATSLANRGTRVILAGTDSDFRGEPFGPMPQLLAVAEVVDKLHAICVICGNPASRNQRLIGGKPARYDSPTIMVGSTESYEARCRACHSVPRRDEDQVWLLLGLACLRPTSGPLCPSICQRQELLARPLIGPEQAPHRARDRLRVLLLDAAHHHAEMIRLDHDADAHRSKHLVERARNLLGEPLLHLQPTREDFDDSRQLAEAVDLAVRDVRDVRAAEERQHVVLAQRVQLDVAHHDHALVRLLEQRIADDLRGIQPISAREP
jgi:thymidine kinase